MMRLTSGWVGVVFLMCGGRLPVLMVTTHRLPAAGARDLLHGRFIIGLHLTVGNVQIDLRRAQARVTEQPLNRGDRHTGFGQMPPEGVAKLMAGDPHVGFMTVFDQAQLNAGDGEARPETIEKHGLLFYRWTNRQPRL